MQNVTKGNYLKKKWLAPLGDLIEFREEENVIYINPVPNCIYDQNSKCLYFTSISRAYAVFKNPKGDYKKATNEKTATFLDSDIVETVNFDNSKVGFANRKKITAILNTYNSYDAKQKQILKEYIHKNVGEALPYTDNDKFRIENDDQLRLLLMGIQQRFYIPPLQNEVQVATNTTKLSNLIRKE